MIKHFVNQVVLELDKPTANGRIYTTDCMEWAVNDYYSKHKEDISFGTLDGSGDIAKASHTVSNLRVEGNHLMATIKVLDTPAGLTLQSIIDSKISVDFVPRGQGRMVLQEDGTYLIEDYELLSIDIVKKD